MDLRIADFEDDVLGECAEVSGVARGERVLPHLLPAAWCFA
jgi:hypothetical protein